MNVTFGKILSLLVAVGYVVFLIIHHVTVFYVVGFCCFFVFLPLRLIWFADYLGADCRRWGSALIDEDTPPILITLMGWFFLVGMPVIYYFLWK